MSLMHTVVCSTRPRRVGLPVAQWFHEVARQHVTRVRLRYLPQQGCVHPRARTALAPMGCTEAKESPASQGASGAKH